MNKKGNFNTILYIVVLVSVFIMFIATSFAYYYKVIKSNKNNTEINSFNMLVTFDNNSQINAHNIKVGWQEEISFSVQNYSKDTIGKYRIIFDVITPLSNTIDDYFVYSIEGMTDSKDTTNRLINIEENKIPVATRELGTSFITPSNTHNYKVVFKLKNNNKKYPKENMFSLRIRVESIN